jgi:hypothetical protein
MQRTVGAPYAFSEDSMQCCRILLTCEVSISDPFVQKHGTDVADSESSERKAKIPNRSEAS